MFNHVTKSDLTKLRNEAAKDRNDILRGMALLSRVVPPFRADVLLIKRELTHITKKLAEIEEQLNEIVAQIKRNQ